MEPKGASGAFCNTILRVFVIQLENWVKTLGSRTTDLLKVRQSKGFTPHSRAGSRRRNIVQELSFSSPGIFLYKGEGNSSLKEVSSLAFLRNIIIIIRKNPYSPWDAT